jgi:Acyltransferase family
MALLYQPGYDPTRVYDGTDTRAFALFIGSALAFVWPSRHLRGGVTKGARWVLDGAGVAGLAVFAVLVWRTSEYSPFLYRGGMVLLSLGTALIVAAVASPASRLGRVLGWQPLRWLGVRSYGIYLWHFPIIVLTSPADGRDTLTRAVLQVAASIGCAALSWRYLEEPIRHGAMRQWWAQVRRNGWRLGALACASYPNMRVYDWAAAVKTSWFISDGIHYTSAGYAARLPDCPRARHRIPGSGPEGQIRARPTGWCGTTSKLPGPLGPWSNPLSVPAPCCRPTLSSARSKQPHGPRERHGLH